jgi:hypothetical protein
MEADRIAEIHAALEFAQGDLNAAAKVLNITRGELGAAIRNSVDLTARWGNKRKVLTAPPNAHAVAIHRSAPPAPPSDDEEVAVALAKEDAALRKGLDAIGVRGDALDLAVNLQKFYRGHFKSTQEMIGGGITKLYFDLMAEFRKLTAMLEEPGLPLGLQESLRQDRRFIIEAMGRTHDRVNKAAYTTAIIKHKLNDKRESKPGRFLAIGISGQNVNVTTSEKEAPEGSGE